MLYTRRGDHGQTCLYDSSRHLPKSDQIFEIIGALDELNATLGVAKTFADAKDARITRFINLEQNHLFIISAKLAGAPKSLSLKAVPSLELFIASIENKIPPLTSFIVPGATRFGAHLDLARTITRRAERLVAHHPQYLKELQYLNRLSSALFGAARFTAARHNIKEHSPTY